MNSLDSIDGHAGIPWTNMKPQIPTVTAPSSLRVAQVLPAMDVGGMEMMVLALSVALRRAGHDARIICTEHEGQLADQVRDAGVPLKLVPAPGITSLVSPRQLADHFRGEAFDVVHSHSGVCAKASRAARLAGIPAVLHTRHGIQTPFSASDLFFLLLGAVQTDVTIGCSVDVVSFYRRWLPWRSDFTLVENGIDDAALDRAVTGPSLREQCDIPTSARVLGTVARLHPVKNQQLLISALSALDRSWHLVLVGEGPLREALTAQAQSAGLAGRVHFAGRRTVTRALYREFDVFALSSLSEAMPMTVLESFASGVPVVAPAVGGLPALLDNGNLGRLYSAGNVLELSAAIQATIAGAGATAAQTDRARARFVERHTVASMTKSYEALYRRVLGVHP